VRRRGCYRSNKLPAVAIILGDDGIRFVMFINAGSIVPPEGIRSEEIALGIELEHVSLRKIVIVDDTIVDGSVRRYDR
jgi:hypothetical protein